jgi:hypothetical protein
LEVFHPSVLELVDSVGLVLVPLADSAVCLGLALVAGLADSVVYLG